MSRPSVTKTDLVVVGGGIIGLAIAREFAQQFAGMRVMVLEKESSIVTHQSLRNSGVVHSGIFTKPGSFSARAASLGGSLLVEYCRQRDLPVERVGKVIVAAHQNELPMLDLLYKYGMENGAPGLEMIGAEHLSEIEPHVQGIKAIYMPLTATVDYARIARAFADDLIAVGGEIVTHVRVDSLTTSTPNIVLITSMDHTQAQWQLEIQADYVITAGGLHEDLLVHMTNPQRQQDLLIVPFRTDYYVLRPEKRDLLRGLVYAVPDSDLSPHGIHFVPHVDGRLLLAPAAALAFAREGYGRKDVNPREMRETAGFPGFQRWALRHGVAAAQDIYRDYNKTAHLKQFQRYLPELTADDLQAGSSGVRALALLRNGTYADDLLIQRSGTVIHVENVPSSAATASLFIASQVAELAERELLLTRL
ncbi:MAG: L-2-hydroxyglutarate oxidase [Anaerolineae bacterium]|nr:L-2-hydroxyglutarate oxidase [Anaerolineae bacterium]